MQYSVLYKLLCCCCCCSVLCWIGRLKAKTHYRKLSAREDPVDRPTVNSHSHSMYMRDWTTDDCRVADCRGSCQPRAASLHYADAPHHCVYVLPSPSYGSHAAGKRRGDGRRGHVACDHDDDSWARPRQESASLSATLHRAVADCERDSSWQSHGHTGCSKSRSMAWSADCPAVPAENCSWTDWVSQCPAACAVHPAAAETVAVSLSSSKRCPGPRPGCKTAEENRERETELARWRQGVNSQRRPEKQRRDVFCKLFRTSRKTHKQTERLSLCFELAYNN